MGKRFEVWHRGNSDHEAQIASSLRWLAWCAVAIFVAFGAATTFLAIQVGGQTERLQTVDAFNEQRTALVAALAQPWALRTAAESEAAIQAAREIEELLSSFNAVETESASVTLARNAASNVITHIGDATRAGGTAKQNIATLRTSLSELREEFAVWQRSVAAAQGDAAMRARLSDNRYSRLNSQLSMLSKAVFSATRIQREIETLALYYEPAVEGEHPLRPIKISLEGMPEPCGPSNAGRARMVCNPSSARVHAAINALRSSSPERLAQRFVETNWSLEAYVRTGERRYTELSAELDSTNQRGTKLRSELNQASQNLSALSRITNITTQTERHLTDTLLSAEVVVDDLSDHIGGATSSIRRRATAIANALQVYNPNIEKVTGILDGMTAQGRDTTIALEQKARHATQLKAALTIIETELERITHSTRASAQAMFGLISSVALAAFALLGLAALVLSWGGQRFVVEPMAQTTGAILSLSRGETSKTFKLGNRFFGQSDLEDALEKLRQANLQREELTRKTIEQSVQIERNLKTLSEKSEEMEFLARHDALTNLPNRRHADEFLALFGEVEPGLGLDFTLLHIDLDGFKAVNDTLGHDAGDVVLRKVAKILFEMCEEGDKAFRIGGDEFLIARTAVPHPSLPMDLAQRIIDAINKPIDYEGHVCRVGASVGIAHGKDAKFNGALAFVNADIALYRAKSNGKNRFAEFSQDLQEEAFSRKSLSDRLLTAIENDEFVPFYHPQFFSDSLYLHGVETLCRWEHPELGMLTPGHFMEQAEASSLVGQIDQMLLRKASQDLKYLQSRGHVLPKISFNATADRLTQAGFADAIASATTPDTKVAIELLESMSLENLSQSVRWVIDELKERGISIEIDDFGSCRASIAGLIAVGPDTMKIDGALIAPITESTQHLRLVSAIIDIGQTLNIDVIAEHVETAEHVRILQDEGCSILQGFALAKPMPVDELADFLDARVDLERRRA